MNLSRFLFVYITGGPKAGIWAGVEASTKAKTSAKVKTLPWVRVKVEKMADIEMGVPLLLIKALEASPLLQQVQGMAIWTEDKLFLFF